MKVRELAKEAELEYERLRNQMIVDEMVRRLCKMSELKRVSLKQGTLDNPEKVKTLGKIRIARENYEALLKMDAEEVFNRLGGPSIIVNVDLRMRVPPEVIEL